MNKSVKDGDATKGSTTFKLPFCFEFGMWITQVLTI